MPRFSRVVFISLCVGLFSGMLYLNSLGNQFTNWDDGMIYGNPLIRHLDWQGVKKMFTYERGSTYQPVRVLSYAFDYSLWRLNPLGYHITNILFYILTCIMVCLTLGRLSAHLRAGEAPDSHLRVALFGGLLFAALPVHVEAVTWLAARKEVLQGFFFFSAFYLYLRGREQEGRKKYVMLGLVLFSMLLAILSKPSAVVFPGVILLYEISIRKSRWVTFIKDHWPFLIISVVICVIFVSILIKVMFDSGGVKVFRGGGFLGNFLLSFYLFIYYIKLLIFTINYSAAYDITTPETLLNAKIVLGVGATVLLFVFSLWSLKKTKVCFFGLPFFFISLLPYLNVIPISTLIADRYVFIASFSFCLLMGVVFNRLYCARIPRFSPEFFKVLSVVVFLLLTVGYSLMTIQQNRIWENSYTLWADAVEKQPGSNTANALMGVVYMGLGMDKEARKYLEKAVQVFPYDYESRNNLGIVYGRLNEPERALQELLISDQLKPEQYAIKINLSVHYIKHQEYQKAEAILQDLIAKSPRDAELHYRLAMMYKEIGNDELAISELIRSSELAPEIITPYEQLGNIYVRLGNIKRAKEFYSKGIAAVPNANSRIDTLRWITHDLEAR